MIEFSQLQQIIDQLKELGLTLATAESCTGGQIAAELTTVPGSSEVVRGGVVAYQIEAKQWMLGLAEVNEENVVSAETARDMATAARECFQAEVGVGTTGYLDGDTPHAFWEIQWLSPFQNAGGSPPLEFRTVNTLKGKIQFPLGSHRRGANRLMLVHEVIAALLSIQPGGITITI